MLVRPCDGGLIKLGVAEMACIASLVHMYPAIVHLPLCDMRTGSAVGSIPADDATDALSHVNITGWMGALRNVRVAHVAMADRDGGLAKRTASGPLEPPNPWDMTTCRDDPPFPCPQLVEPKVAGGELRSGQRA